MENLKGVIKNYKNLSFVFTKVTFSVDLQKTIKNGGNLASFELRYFGWIFTTPLRFSISDRLFTVDLYIFFLVFLIYYISLQSLGKQFIRVNLIIQSTGHNFSAVFLLSLFLCLYLYSFSLSISLSLSLSLSLSIYLSIYLHLSLSLFLSLSLPRNIYL